MFKRLFVIAVLAANCGWAQAARQEITVNYPARAPSNWPLFIAKEGGYFEKYGLNVKLTFGVHPAGIAMLISGEAAMTNYTLEQAMQAASKDASLVAVASGYKKGLWALMASKDIANARDLKGKRLGVSQIGDAPYNYTVAMLAKFGVTQRDVQWITLGTDVNGRAAALVAGRVDATLLTSPAYYKLEEMGFRSLGNLVDFDDIYAPTVYLFKKSTLAANPKLAETLIKAQAEAIKRFYDDEAFAVKAYLPYDSQSSGDIERQYDHYKKTNTFERIPYIPAAAVQFVVNQQADPQMAAQMKGFDFRKVIDNTIVDRLVKEGFFEQLFGAAVKAEEERKAKTAFR
ncbi:MAG TPA: ABC transporter substrate-binding protein [Bryobacteraceae bacterium]|jgi:ABC-type nitrate/sulfonate/bicarbonate transport system substrate-binding protein